MEKSLGSWWTVLPTCPKKICASSDGEAINPDHKTWTDPNVGFIGGLILDYFHPGATYEIRTVEGRKGSPHGNQCTYNSKGHLVPSQPAAGTAD